MQFQPMKMFHTYDHQVLFGGVVDFRNILKNVFHHVVLFVKSLFAMIHNDLVFLKKQFMLIASDSSGEIDFYFIGTIVLFCGLLYLTKVLFDLLESAFFDKNQMETRVFLLRKRIDELYYENKKLLSTLDSFQQDVNEFRKSVDYCLNYQDDLYKKYQKELKYLKKEISKYD